MKYPTILTVLNSELYNRFLKKRESLRREDGKLMGKSSIINALIKLWVDNKIEIENAKHFSF